MHCDTVTIIARFKLVTQLELQTILMPEVRVIQIGHMASITLEQHLFFKVQQFRIFFRCFFPPRIEMFTRHHFGTNTLVIEIKQLIIIHQDVTTTRFVFKLFHFLQKLTVLFKERVFGFPLTFNQCTTNKDFAANGRIDTAVVHQTFRYDWHAVKHDFFVRHHRRAFLRPMRFAVTALDKVFG